MKIIKRTLINLTALLITSVTIAQTDSKIEAFKIDNIELTASQFKSAESMDIQYLLGINPDRLLAPYLKEAGLTPKAPNYTNWENTGLDGHIGGHYVSALAYMYAATGNQEIKNRLEYMISELNRCQDSNGYLSGVVNGRQIWKEISEGNIRAAAFGLNDRWVPLYNIHKIYAGLRDAYLIAGNQKAKNMLIKLTDWMYETTKNLSNEQLQDMLRSEHGGLNETFADVAAITGNKKYLELAHRFSHNLLLEPLLRKEDKLTGMHANTQIPKVIGFKRIAEIENNNEWENAAKFFWETVINNRSITIGGNSVNEHFHPATDFSSMMTSEQGPETCNTYNMLRLTKMLYQSSGNVKYMDFYERALYNHILSTINPIQGGFVYFTPMRPGHYRVYSQTQTSFWCCVGSGMENHARYGEMIYAHKGDNLYVNMFIPSKLEWNNIDIEQVNNFPQEESTTIVVNPEKSKTNFTLKVRIPEWISNEGINITINGISTPFNTIDGYATIERTWRKGDRVKVELPMKLRAIGLPDGSANYSFMYGPIVLASSLGKEEQYGMYADDSRGGHIANGPRWSLQNMPVIIGDRDNILSHIEKVEHAPLTFKLKGVYPNHYNEMILKPFNTIHECRYMVYWPVVNREEFKARETEIAKQEQERIAIDAITADKVTCGEQQPESDHFIEYKKSYIGSDEGIQWRETTEWFSYKMNGNGKSIKKLRIVYLTDMHRDAVVYINNIEIGKIIDNEWLGKSITEIELPMELQSAGSYVVKIGKGEKFSTQHIYEVRLMN